MDAARLESALRNAHAAGDTEAARKLANALRQSRATGGGQPAKEPAKEPAKIKSRAEYEADLATAEQGSRDAQSDINLWSGVRDFISGPEAIGTVAINAPNTVASGLTGLGTSLANLLGLTDVEGADAVRGVQAATLHAPATPGAQAILGVVGAPGEMLERGGHAAGDATLDATDSPLLATAADVAAQSLPDILLGGASMGSKVVRAGRVPKPVNAAQTPTQVARAADFKVLPSEAGGGRIAQGLERFGGEGLKRDFRKANEAKTTEIAKEEIGGTSLSKKDFQRMKSDGGKAYAEMEKIGNVVPDDQLLADLGALNPRKGMTPNVDIEQLRGKYESLAGGKHTASQVMTEVRQLRKEAAKNSAPPALGAKPDPAKQSLAKAQLQVADALDGWLERNAETVGKPEVAQGYREARRQLAKVNAVENATSGGKVDIKNFTKQDDKNVPLSGRLGVAQQVGEFFPDSTGAARGPAVELPDSMAQSGIIRDLIARPIAKRILMSNWYQNQFGLKAPQLENALAGDFFATPGPDFPPRTTPPSPTGAGSVEFENVAPQAASARRANNLAGDLELAPEGPAIDLPPAPDRLTASVPPELSGLPFTPSQLPIDAGALSLIDELFGGIPGGQAPRATGMAEQVPGTTLFPELRAVRQGAEVGDGLSLADELSLVPDEPPSQLRYEGQPAPEVPPQGDTLGIAPQGVQRSVTGYRGVGPGRDPFSTDDTHGNALFFSPDEATAASYMTPGGQVASRQLDFQNLLEADTLQALQQALGLPATAELLDIINKARGIGYDGLSYDLKPGREFVQIPRDPAGGTR